ncbi:unnamed protein product [Phaedon cochleariae]|uniref:PHD-type domain-containing protein n=1 Tax=Phaedon cochleariae TaxID=80249 RepID=A0A9N9SDA3_PHACE|nr:unnamed protein product [Phaedon cochleariae]
MPSNDQPSTSAGMPSTSFDKPSTSNVSKKSRNKTSRQDDDDDDDWECGVCGDNYSEDYRRKNGAKWVQCSYCLTPYHLKCQASDNEEDVSMCDNCVGCASEESD